MEGTVGIDTYWLTNLAWLVLVIILIFRLHNSIPQSLVQEALSWLKDIAKDSKTPDDDKVVGVLDRVVNYIWKQQPQPPTTPPDDPAPPTTPPPTGEQPRTINQNAKLLGDTVVEAIPTSDGRYQFQPNLYEVVIEPGNIGVPPYINKVPNAAGDGNHAKIEITEINGVFGYRTFVTLKAGKCYLLKLTGSWSLDQVNGKGVLQDVALGGKIVTDGGAVTLLPSQGFSSWIGSRETVFAFKSDINTGAWVSGFINVTWASLKGVYELQAFEVMEAPAGYCGDGVNVVSGAQG